MALSCQRTTASLWWEAFPVDADVVVADWSEAAVLKPDTFCGARAKHGQCAFALKTVRRRTDHSSSERGETSGSRPVSSKPGADIS